jgi:hypothetical protein
MLEFPAAPYWLPFRTVRGALPREALEDPSTVPPLPTISNWFPIQATPYNAVVALAPVVRAVQVIPSAEAYSCGEKFAPTATKAVPAHVTAL